MIDLSTTYMGIKLQNPLVVSPSPLCEKIDNIKKMEDAGASAVILQSLFEEQINFESVEVDRFLMHGKENFAESFSYFPNLDYFNVGPNDYLDLISKAKSSVKIPIIASLNGVSIGGWTIYAKEFEKAGADAVELNIYYIPADLDMVSQQVEQMYIDVARSVKNSVNIPVALKISPYFSSMANMAKQFDQIGVNALVMFNRFYQPDIDPAKLEVKSKLVLSTSDELTLRLRWVAIIYSHINADMAITGGIHTAEDVIKSMMVGAKVAMMTSALLKNSINHLTTVKDGMVKWMEEHDYSSVADMQGKLSQQSVVEPAAFERANYMKLLKGFMP